MSKLEEYLDDVKGMDRIELVLDLLVDGKITKAQAVVLIANDKIIKDNDKPTLVKDWWNSGSATTTTPCVPLNQPYYHTTSAPYGSTITTTALTNPHTYTAT